MRAGYKSKGTSSSTAVPIFFLFCGHRQRQRRLLVAGARRPLCSPHPHHIHPSIRPPIIPWSLLVLLPNRNHRPL
jgi:hypothetical protein